MYQTSTKKCLATLVCFQLVVGALVVQSSVQEESVVCFAFIASQSLVTVHVLWLFLTVPWVALRCVIVVFLDHSHFLFAVLGISKH